MIQNVRKKKKRLRIKLVEEEVFLSKVIEGFKEFMKSPFRR